LSQQQSGIEEEAERNPTGAEDNCYTEERKKEEEKEKGRSRPSTAAPLVYWCPQVPHVPCPLQSGTKNNRLWRTAMHKGTKRPDECIQKDYPTRIKDIPPPVTVGEVGLPKAVLFFYVPPSVILLLDFQFMSLKEQEDISKFASRKMRSGNFALSKFPLPPFAVKL
jgi:hypothetical protein